MGMCVQSSQSDMNRRQRQGAVRQVLFKHAAAFAFLALTTGAHATSQRLAGSQFDVIFDDAIIATYGQPLLLGNVLVFTPSQLVAESTNGLGSVTVSANFELQILPHIGFNVDQLTLTQRGDYKLRGAGSTVSVGGLVTISTLVDPVRTLSSHIAPDGAPLTNNDGALHNWHATTLLDLSGAMQIGSGEGVNLLVNHTLEAFTDPAASGRRQAFVQEKFSGVNLVVTVSQATPSVPEPENLALSLAGIAVLGVVAARARRA